MGGLKVSLSFNRATDYELVDFTNTIIKAMTGNASFATPPVTVEQLSTALKEFSDALSRKKTSGRPGTERRDTTREGLLAMMRTLASYVQAISKDNADIMYSSGFSPVVFSRTRRTITQPQIKSVTQGLSTQLIVKVAPVANSRGYEARFKSTSGEWQSAGFHTDSRRILVAGLTPATFYDVHVRATGIDGYSDWSPSMGRIVT